MKSAPPQHPELSGWWFTGFLATFASMVAVMIAVNQGTQSVRTLALCYLIGLFISAGALLSTLIANAVGLSQKWEIANVSNGDDPGTDPPGKRRKDLLTEISERTSREHSFSYEEEPETSYVFAEETISEQDKVHVRRRPRRRAA